MFFVALYVFILIISVTESTLIFKTNVAEGTTCTQGFKCLFAKDCVNDGTKDICICRRIYNDLFANGSCTLGYSPLGLNPAENGILLDQTDKPQYNFEKLPDSSFKEKSPGQAGFGPEQGRLRNVKSWCGDMVDDTTYLQIDLLVTSEVSIIGTEGRDDSIAHTAVKLYNLQISDQADSNYENVQDSNGNTITFSGNKNENTPVHYNILNPPIKGRYIRIIPVDHRLQKCMRVELYGDRVFNECGDSSTNFCHNEAICTDTDAAFYCTCPPSYWNKEGDGSVCERVNECTTSLQEFKHNCSKYGHCSDTQYGFECNCFPEGRKYSFC